MVTIIDFERYTNEKDEPFQALILRGEVEMVRSKKGNIYATAKKARIPSTFDERTCQELLGTKMPGEIQRVPCDPYEYLIEETGETVVLEHTYEYVPDPVTTEDHVFENREDGVAV